MPTKKILVKGLVQGVFYRAGAKELAAVSGVTGWIRNTKQGDVEAVITGSTDQLDQFINWCRRGPARAMVSDVKIFEEPDTQFKDFRILR